jgi:hypothetical protein
MTALQRGAALRLRRGDKTKCGWTLLAIVPAEPWPWVLAERGNTIGRWSPRGFLVAMDTK